MVSVSDWYLPIERRLLRFPLPPLSYVKRIIDSILFLQHRRDELKPDGLNCIEAIVHDIRLSRAQLVLGAMLKGMLGGTISDKDFVKKKKEMIING